MPHLSLRFILLPALLLSLTHCKLSKEEDFGPQADPNNVLDTMLKSFNNKNMSDASVGNWVVYQSTQRAFTQTPIVSGYEAYQVLSRTDEKEHIAYEIAKTVYDSSENIVDKAVDSCIFLKKSRCTNCDASPVGCPTETSSLEAQRLFVNDVSPRAEERPTVSIHKFNHRKLRLEPPHRVKNSDDCRGLKNCILKVTEIAYDLVEKFQNGDAKKTHIEMQITPDIPYIGSLYSQCAYFVAVLDDRQVPITLCRRIVDFQFENSDD